MSMHVLVVEDNEGDQKILKETFDRCNTSAELVFAENSDEAMTFLKNGMGSSHKLPRMIMLDLNLPKKSGKDLLKELKIHDKYKKIPIIILTSSNAETDITECYDSGANCYLKKPMRFADFQNMTEAICRFWLKEVMFPKISD